MSGFTQLKPIAKTDNEKPALLEEPWFHGAISRQESEALVVKDGDFLVRESLTTPGQYVLTGMQKSTRKHLLLVDPEGVVSKIFSNKNSSINVCFSNHTSKISKLSHFYPHYICIYLKFI